MQNKKLTSTSKQVEETMFKTTEKCIYVKWKSFQYMPIRSLFSLGDTPYSLQIIGYIKRKVDEVMTLRFRGWSSNFSPKRRTVWETDRAREPRPKGLSTEPPLPKFTFENWNDPSLRTALPPGPDLSGPLVQIDFGPMKIVTFVPYFAYALVTPYRRLIYPQIEPEPLHLVDQNAPDKLQSHPDWWHTL